MDKLDDLTLPNFRRGTSQLPRLFRYKGVSRTHIEAAWRRLCDDSRYEIREAEKIADAMGVGRGSATRYRRVFAALDLIKDIPGIWNSDKPDVPHFDASSIEDGAAGYSSFSEWENYSAEIIMLTKEHQAFEDLTRGYRIHVLSSQPEYDISLVRFAHGVPPTSAITLFSHDALTNTYIEVPGTPDENFFPVLAAPVLVLVETSDRGSCERSEHPMCCLRGDKALAEIRKITGKSQASAYRLVNEMVGDRTATKVSKGLWNFQ